MARKSSLSIPVLRRRLKKPISTCRYVPVRMLPWPWVWRMSSSPKAWLTKPLLPNTPRDMRNTNNWRCSILRRKWRRSPGARPIVSVRLPGSMPRANRH